MTGMNKPNRKDGDKGNILIDGYECWVINAVTQVISLPFEPGVKMRKRLNLERLTRNVYYRLQLSQVRL